MPLTSNTARSLVALLLSAAVACSGSAFGGKTPKRYDRTQAQAALRKFEKPGLLIGEFALQRKGVVDGDTIKVEGLDTSIRLLAIDTEEKFWTAEERRKYEMGWEVYLKTSRGDSVTPVKLATPVGEEASAWAKEWFKDVDVVRLERDHPRELRDRYNRYLAYCIAKKNGAWVNYHVEVVRAGMSPYFMKYGYSRRYHAELVAAQDEARAAKRGIWDPDKQHSPDYDERLAWWTARADFIQQFDRDAEGRDDHIILTHWDSVARLEAHVGKPVEILATVGSIKLGDKGPTLVMLSRRMFVDFTLVFFDKDVFGSSGIERYRGEFIRVQGTVARYYNKFKKKNELQMIIDLPSQVTGTRLPWLEHEGGDQ